MEDIVKKIEEESKELKNTISNYLLEHFDDLKELHFPLSSGFYSLIDAVIINVDKDKKRFSYKTYSALFPDKDLTSTVDLDNIQFFQIEDLIELIEYLENNKKLKYENVIDFVRNAANCAAQYLLKNIDKLENLEFLLSQKGGAKAIITEVNKNEGWISFKYNEDYDYLNLKMPFFENLQTLLDISKSLYKKNLK